MSVVNKSLDRLWVNWRLFPQATFPHLILCSDNFVDFNPLAENNIWNERDKEIWKLSFSWSQCIKSAKSLSTTQFSFSYNKEAWNPGFSLWKLLQTNNNKNWRTGLSTYSIEFPVTRTVIVDYPYGTKFVTENVYFVAKGIYMWHTIFKQHKKFIRCSSDFEMAIWIVIKPSESLLYYLFWSNNPKLKNPESQQKIVTH